MSASALLDELRSLGARVWPDAGMLHVKAPVGAMTPELTARVKAAKPELLALLEADSAGGPDLPLLAAIAEFDALIERLCDLSKHSPNVRERMRQVRRHMAPVNIPRELESVRCLVKHIEVGRVSD